MEGKRKDGKMSKMIKRVIFLAVVVCVASSAFAVPTIELSPDQSTAGSWSYDGAGTFSFIQNITVDRGLGNSSDPLVGAFVHIPNLAVSGIPGGDYTLSGGTISIESSATSGAGIVYLTGTLGTGNLVAVGSMAACYTAFQVDITDITINNTTLDSAALAAIDSMAGPKRLDFELSMTGGTSSGFADMLDNGLTGSDGFSGAMTIPEPATIILLGGSAGLLALTRKRRFV